MLKFGIAGVGRWGQVLIDSVYGKSDKLAFTAGVTGRKERAQAYCDEKGIDLRDRYEQLLEDDTLDAIVLATPHAQHAEQIIGAATAGKPVFCEKPLTLTSEDAERASDAMAGAGLPLCVAFNRRFLPAMQKLVSVAKDGTLGTLLHVEGNISGDSGIRYGNNHWRAESHESPAGGMTPMGVHMLDAMISVAGHASSVRAVSERIALTGAVDDTTFATLKFKNGPTGVLTTLNATRQLWRIQVFGDKGWAEVRDMTRFELRPIDGEPEVIEFDPFDMNRAELEAFADVLTDGTPFPVPLEDALHGVDILDAIIRASKDDSRINFD